MFYTLTLMNTKKIQNKRKKITNIFTSHTHNYILINTPHYIFLFLREKLINEVSGERIVC